MNGTYVLIPARAHHDLGRIRFGERRTNAKGSRVTAVATELKECANDVFAMAGQRHDIAVVSHHVARKRQPPAPFLDGERNHTQQPTFCFERQDERIEAAGVCTVPGQRPDRALVKAGHRIAIEQVLPLAKRLLSYRILQLREAGNASGCGWREPRGGMSDVHGQR
jgi:hypothetical protein